MAWNINRTPCGYKNKLPLCLNSQYNILDSFRKRKMIMRMKVKKNKLIFTKFGRIVFDVCRGTHNELPLVELAMHLKKCHLQDLIFQRIVLLHLEFIIQFIESSCTRLILPNIDNILYKKLLDLQ